MLSSNIIHLPIYVSILLIHLYMLAANINTDILIYIYIYWYTYSTLRVGYIIYLFLKTPRVAKSWPTKQSTKSTIQPTRLWGTMLDNHLSYTKKKWILIGLHPGRLTWNLQIIHLERKMIFQTCIIMFHVNLPGCTFNSQGTSKIQKCSDMNNYL